MINTTPIGRRGFIGATIASAALATQTDKAQALDGADVYRYPVTRTDEAWRARLSEIEYHVLRRGGTEAPRTSPLWNSKDVGVYCCQGCDLTIYRSLQKIELDKGWVFFRHSLKDSVMTSLDVGKGMPGDPFAEMQAMMEVHCRRCGSHLGHIVALVEVRNRPIHCINGTALNFQPENA